MAAGRQEPGRVRPSARRRRRALRSPARRTRRRRSDRRSQHAGPAAAPARWRLRVKEEGAKGAELAVGVSCGAPEIQLVRLTPGRGSRFAGFTVRDVRVLNPNPLNPSNPLNPLNPTYERWP